MLVDFAMEDDIHVLMVLPDEFVKLCDRLIQLIDELSTVAHSVSPSQRWTTYWLLGAASASSRILVKREAKREMEGERSLSIIDHETEDNGLSTLRDIAIYFT